jgi:hypothetical protein
MKNLLLVSALTLTLACTSGEQASAWVNSQFGMGLNWNFASGGNSYFWGLVRDGQPYGADFCHSLQTVAVPPAVGPCTPVPPANVFPCPHHHGVAPVVPAPVPAPTYPAAAAAAATTAPAAASQSLYRPSYYQPYYYYYQPRR